MHIGSINLTHPFCQAGLAGYSDRAMRTVARRRGCPYAVTEALLDTIILQRGEGRRKSLDISEEDHPVAGQLIGSDAETMAPAAKILHEAGFDVIDLNFACPVKKMRNKSRGGHMLRDVPRGIEIIRAVRDSLPTNATITLSIRRGFDDSPESVDQFHEIVRAAWQHGLAAVRVHGRSVEQRYLGKADWNFLRDVKREYPDKTILGSGDVFTAEDAVRMLRETGVDIVWIARGAIGNPWIFEQAIALLNRGLSDSSDSISPPTVHAQRDALSEHFALAMQIHGEQLAGRRMRKMGIKYARFHPQAMQVKREFIEVKSLRDWNRVLENFYANDLPGIWPAIDAADEVNDDTSCAIAIP